MPLLVCCPEKLVTSPSGPCVAETVWFGDAGWKSSSWPRKGSTWSASRSVSLIGLIDDQLLALIAACPSIDVVRRGKIKMKASIKGIVLRSRRANSGAESCFYFLHYGYFIYYGG